MKISVNIFLVIFSTSIYAQTGTLIGTNKTPFLPESSAELEVYSLDKGVLVPSFTTAAISSITNPTDGMLIYDKTLNVYKYRFGTDWIAFPARYTTEIVDAQPDSKVQTERGGNDANIFFTLNSTDVATLNKNGFDLASGETYTIAGNRTFFELGTNTVIGNAGNILSVTAQNNTIAGYTAGNKVVSSAKNTIAGAEAGTVLTGGNNTLFGFSAGKSMTQADSNVVIGALSAQNITSGDGNIVVGYNSAIQATVGVGNLVIGNNTANNLTTGDKNVIIGNNISVPSAVGSNYMTLGGAINSDNMVLGNINFHNAYTFPTNTIGDDKTLVLNADLKTLEWKATSSVNSIDIAGAAADLQSFDIGNVQNGQYDGNYKVIILKMTAYSNAEIKYMTNRLLNNGSGTIQMSIYNSSGLRLGTGTTTCNASGYNDVALTPDIGTSILVETGNDYYLAVSINSATNPAYIQSSTTGIAEAWYIDNAAQCPHPNSFNPTTLTGFVTCGGLSRNRVATGNIIWIRAY